MPNAAKQFRQQPRITRGKASSERHKFYDTAAWRGTYRNGRWHGGLRHAALCRDNYVCQECEALVSGKTAHVDHIQTIEDRPDLRADINNLRTLCGGCHGKKTKREQS